jgi:hypothetical protein
MYNYIFKYPYSKSSFLLLSIIYLCGCGNDGTVSKIHPDITIYINKYENIIRMIDKNNAKDFEKYYSMILDSDRSTLINFSNYDIADVSEVLVIDSKVFVLDLISPSVHKIDLTENSSTDFTPRGRGPGDIISPTNMVVIGDTLVIADRVNGFIFYTVDGEHISTVHPGFSVEYFCILNDQLFIKSPYIIEGDKRSNHLIHRLDNEFGITESFGFRYPHQNIQLSNQLSMGKLVCSSEYGVIINTYVYGTPVVEFFAADDDEIDAILFKDNNPVIIELIDDVPLISDTNRGKKLHLYSNAAILEDRFFTIQFEHIKSGSSHKELVTYLYCLESKDVFISQEIPLIKWASGNRLLFQHNNEDDGFILSTFRIIES